jgi:hypothetical protein
VDPVACSLGADGAAGRLAEWRRLVEEHGAGTERTPGRIRLRLVEGDAALLAAADLGRREQACCPFLTVRLDLRDEAAWLEVLGPPEAGPVLDALLGG